MANAKFTERLNIAMTKLLADASMRAVACRSGSLFSPVYRESKYVWIKVMDSDGILVARREVHYGDEGAQPTSTVSLLLGVVIQSEDATSQTKPNPLGKASLSQVPYGIWVDLVDSGRERLDRVLVVFVLPKGAAPKRQAPFLVAKRNVLNASDMMSDAISIEVSRGSSAKVIAEAVRAEVRPYLIGRGRPRHAAA